MYCELDAPADKECVSSNKECVHSIAGKCFKDSFDFATITRLNDLDLKPDIRCCHRYVLRYALCLQWLPHSRCSRHELESTKHLQLSYREYSKDDLDQA